MAVGDSYRYNLNECAPAVDGAPLSGSGPDSFVQIQFAEPVHTAQFGATGEMTSSASNVKGGTVRVTLMQTARASIEVMEAVMARHERGVGPSIFELVTPTEKITCSGCWGGDRPQYNYGKTATPREYVLNAAAILRVPIGV